MFGNLFSKAKSALKSIADDEGKCNSYADSAFDAVDKDKSGYVERNEIGNLVKELVSKFKKDFNIPEDKLTEAMNLMDKDGDGKISKEEFRKTSRLQLLRICA